MNDDDDLGGVVELIVPMLVLYRSSEHDLV
jgi:hypothetical protein